MKRSDWVVTAILLLFSAVTLYAAYAVREENDLINQAREVQQ